MNCRSGVLCECPHVKKERTVDDPGHSPLPIPPEGNPILETYDNAFNSIELDILEEAVANVPPSLWTVVDYIGRYDPRLDQVGPFRAARDLVQEMVNKEWVRVVLKANISGMASMSYPSIWPEDDWENELKKFVVVATPKGEVAYLSYGVR